MLVLSRKKLESIVIDEQIIITVVEIRGDKVRLGIEAPGTFPSSAANSRIAISLSLPSRVKLPTMAVSQCPIIRHWKKLRIHQPPESRRFSL